MATAGVSRYTKISCKWVIGFIGFSAPIRFLKGVQSKWSWKTTWNLRKQFWKVIDRAQVSTLLVAFNHLKEKSG